MEYLKAVYDWIIDFFGINQLLQIISSGNYSSLLTYDGILSVIRPLFPLLLVIEIIKALLFKKFKSLDYKIPFFSYVLNAFIGRFISIAMVVLCIGVFEKYAIIKTTFTWYWFIYGYIIWEFGHFIYHYVAHKVRLFWCLHSTHHFPDTINIAVAYNRFFLEQSYIDFVKTSICILMGYKATGRKVIPWVTTGHNTRPRIDHPVSWTKVAPDEWVSDGTPQEIAANLNNALQWVSKNNEIVEANAILIYAWNEFDEGGWICPTLGNNNSRLEAVKAVLKK